MSTKHHQPRLNAKDMPEAIYSHMTAYRGLLDQSGLEPGLRDLIKVRASQINGCAFCLDTHVREAREHGITDDRLHLVCVWHETDSFSEAERAALALTEAVTNIADDGVPDFLYEEVRRHYNAEEYFWLLTTTNAINSWNRFMISIAALPPKR